MRPVPGVQRPSERLRRALKEMRSRRSKPGSPHVAAQGRTSLRRSGGLACLCLAIAGKEILDEASIARRKLEVRHFRQRDPSNLGVFDAAR